MLEKFISGGQTGMDKIGLEVGRIAGIETGGTAAKYWMTEDGPDETLEGYGLVQCDEPGYPPRTRKNVEDSDMTVIFGTSSGGSKLTEDICDELKKPCAKNPTSED